MPVLFLSEDDVRHVLTMDMALDAVEQGLKKLSLDEAINIPRSRCQTDHAMLHVLPAAGKTLGVLGFKAYVTSRRGAGFHFHLFDGKTGEHLAWMQADWLGQMRTGAASGVATRLMARANSAIVGIFGSGKQARTQIQAVCRVRQITSVHVFSPNEERRKNFAAEMSTLCGVEVVPVSRPEQAAKGMDIVITATTSREPIVKGEWIGDGTHLNVIGSNFLSKAEVDVETVRKANRIVVDSKDQARIEAGDLHFAAEAGALNWTTVLELGHIAAGRFPGRENDSDITLFKSLGIAMEDLATAAKVYAHAKEKGLGKILDL
jgi:ornithine cyclodeaminase/alanine dehydrogenase-like protein (mu-crystallin family)